MNNKLFTVYKIGYTAGVYGCTGEYFLLIVTRDGTLYSDVFYGLYGAEQRIESQLKGAGYTFVYSGPSVYGRLTRKDIPNKHVYSEHAMINQLKEAGILPQNDNQ